MSSTTTRTLPLITLKEFESAYDAHGRVLVSLNHRKVYDVTDFLDDHPGGGDIVLKYSGRDVSEIMDDVDSHIHSESAYEMLDEDYMFAILATPEEEEDLLSDSNRDMFSLQESNTAGGKVTGTNVESAYTVVTNFSKDYDTNKFLDLNKPLLPQMLFGKFDKEFYLDQVHKPRHYGKGSAPLFGNFLEPISLTPWYLVPILWIPADIYACSLALEGLSWPVFVPTYILGLFIWTLVEYILHRFLFHLDDHLPNNQIAFTLHFLLHGVHHYLPMDPMRLVMPPALLVVLTTPLYKLAHLLFPYHYAMTIFAGAFFGYICYDCTHYFLHHIKLPAFMKATKTNHLDHHYKDYKMGFGVTSKLWDVVFGTELMNTNKKR